MFTYIFLGVSQKVTLQVHLERLSVAFQVRKSGRSKKCSALFQHWFVKFYKKMVCNYFNNQVVIWKLGTQLENDGKSKICMSTSFNHKSLGVCISNEILPPTCLSTSCCVAFILSACLAALWSIHMIMFISRLPASKIDVDMISATTIIKHSLLF